MPSSKLCVLANFALERDFVLKSLDRLTVQQPHAWEDPKNKKLTVNFNLAWQAGGLGRNLDEVDWGFIMSVLAHNEWQKMDLSSNNLDPIAAKWISRGMASVTTLILLDLRWATTKICHLCMTSLSMRCEKRTQIHPIYL